MNKPQPKSDPTVTIGIAREMRITTHSNRTELWVEQEAKGFGRLKSPTESISYYRLQVLEGYDMDEVKAYLESID